MDIEQQVTSLELSKKLKELGVKQEFEHGDWGYCDCHNDLHLLHDDNDTGDFMGEDYRHYVKKEDRWSDIRQIEWTKAFTVAELGEMLPHRKKWSEEEVGKWSNDWILIERLTVGGGGRCFVLSYKGDNDEIFRQENYNEANCRAEMLIYLLENKLINL